MQLTDRIHVVGSGTMGFDLTDPYDCHIFLVDGGSELAVVDVGSGMGVPAVLENIRNKGVELDRVRHVVLTHAHVDHAGGAAKMRAGLPNPTVYVSRVVADLVRTGDEKGVSLDVAKKAGFYPEDYTLEPCEVDAELVEGDEIVVGDLRLQVLDTPGHCDGHVSLALDHGGTRTLFAGDVVFFGGTILLQNIHDCRLDAQIDSLRKLRTLDVTGLLPGHLTVSLRDGQRHIERANEALDRLLIPNQMVSAW